MTLQPLVLFLHLLGAVVLVGSSLYGPLVLASIRRADDLASLRGWLRHARDAARANPISAFAVLVSGVVLGRGRWSEPWLVVSTIEFVASAILASAVEARTRRMERLAMTAAGGPIVEPLDRLRTSRALDAGARALLANDVALLFLMVQQPGLAGSLAVVLLANSAAAAWRLVGRRDAADVRSADTRVAAAPARRPIR
jgi:uncharacterized membrane protein